MKLTNNLPKIEKQMRKNVENALVAMGDDAVTSIQYMMLYGYSDPHPNRGKGKNNGYHTQIYDTGALFRDVQYHIDDQNTIHVGNTLYYASYVHEGTRKLKGRPYITDGCTTVADFEGVAKKELKKGLV